MKKKIISIFQHLLNYNKIIQNPYKVRAYEVAISALQSARFAINHKNVDKIRDIGAKSRKKIHEIIDTGTLSEITYIDKVFNKLAKLPGFSGKFIGKIIDEHKIADIDDIPLHYKLTEAQKIGIKYHKKISNTLTRAQVEAVSRKIPGTDMVLAGSYRRGKNVMGDVDILVFGKYEIPNDAIIISKGNKKSMILLEIPGTNGKLAQVDIRKMSIESLIPAVIYFTGSKDFNIKLRSHAKKLGYKLNEYSLTAKNGEKFTFDTEKDLFNVLGLKYVPPEKR